MLILNSVFGQDTKVWSLISEKTWFTKNVDIGQNLVFYEKHDGRKEAVIQRHGSGMYVTGYSEFDVTIKNNQIFFSTNYADNSDVVTHDHLTLTLQSNGRLTSTDSSVEYVITGFEPFILKPNGDIVNIDSLKTFSYNFTMDRFLKIEYFCKVHTLRDTHLTVGVNNKHKYFS